MASRVFAADEPAQPTCTFGYVQGLLGQNKLTPRRMAQYLTALIEQHGFPAPLPALVKGGTLTTGVHPRSTWIRAAVHAWLDGTLPPPIAATLDQQAFAAAAMDMDARAATLRLVGGRDVA
ncbi:MAG: hypothetical protein B7Y36_08360 [Novosphingobium sp. 28-62-57]|uniref:hypothetical protein n=1 Tax=unclassified Novosphingobium TaxID=2644732 RepID=UPI000BCC88C8|nr:MULTISPECIES: hypothetical protein [unclassified Novosphingobium]OYW47936.1 MAG: hypothetical protein B7Z36_01450 [Novosphingobium sp. 12-63-9]OYZ10829.1 MAG: hypothetical protein B7Y36_08360 [Novosphingobium sp. 28-62-57]OZA32842.1 MAG: hypothetical protein B7X92_12070 [Novosphingobium sp. 17-62-9]HQS70018.1 hypothetical protein [Novosphingobium sp.]